MRHIPAHLNFPILEALRLHHAGKFFGFEAVGYNNVINIIIIYSVGKREEDIETDIFLKNSLYRQKMTFFWTQSAKNQYMWRHFGDKVSSKNSDVLQLVEKIICFNPAFHKMVFNTKTIIRRA